MRDFDRQVLGKPGRRRARPPPYLCLALLVLFVAAVGSMCVGALLVALLEWAGIQERRHPTQTLTQTKQPGGHRVNHHKPHRGVHTGRSLLGQRNAPDEGTPQLPDPSSHTVSVGIPGEEKRRRRSGRALLAKNRGGRGGNDPPPASLPLSSSASSLSAQLLETVVSQEGSERSQAARRPSLTQMVTPPSAVSSALVRVFKESRNVSGLQPPEERQVGTSSDREQVEVFRQLVTREASSKLANSLRYFELKKLMTAHVVHHPFPHIFVKGFVKSHALTAINADFPMDLTYLGRVTEGSLNRAGEVRGAFKELLTELRSRTLQMAFAAVFDVDLQMAHPRLVLFGKSDAYGAAPHLEMNHRLICVHVYLTPSLMSANNNAIDRDAGHIRMLKSSNLTDSTNQYSSEGGNLVAFMNPDAFPLLRSRKVAPRTSGFTGYRHFEGSRREVSLRYQVTPRAMEDE